MSNSEGQGRGSGEFLEPVKIPIEEGSSYRDLSADSWVTVETEEDDADQNLFPEVSFQFVIRRQAVHLIPVH